MNTIRLIPLFMAGLLMGLASQFAVGETATDAERASDLGDKKLLKGMQRYVLSLQGCAFEFVAKEGGRAEADESSSPYPYGYFSYDRYVNGEKPPSTSFICYPGNATELCLKLLPVEPTENIRYYNIRRFENLHPAYFNIAQISSFPLNSSLPGQVRSLSFCLGDNTHTLITSNGGFELGYDSRDVSETPGKKLQSTSETALPATLEIIRSIRFLPSDSE